MTRAFAEEGRPSEVKIRVLSGVTRSQGWVVLAKESRPGAGKVPPRDGENDHRHATESCTTRASCHVNVSESSYTIIDRPVLLLSSE
jgi:hypothetical protein